MDWCTDNVVLTGETFYHLCPVMMNVISDEDNSLKAQTAPEQMRKSRNPLHLVFF